MHEDDDSYCMTPREIAATVAFWLLLACAALFVLAWYFFASTASAHDAPTGWTYPYSCCSRQDCREVSSGPEGKVRETPQGYQIASTGEVIPYGDIRVKDSPDGAFHWCSVAGAEDTRTICLFVPPRSY